MQAVTPLLKQQLLRPYLAALLLLFSASTAHSASWTYDEDETGQEDWQSLSPAYLSCYDGQQQSPIQIGATTHKAMPALSPQLGVVKAQWAMVDHTLELKPKTVHRLRNNGVDYQLESIRFHYPSEHMIGEKFWMVEMRYYYRAKTGERLAIATFGDMGEDNPALSAVFDQVSEKNNADFSFDLKDLMPNTDAYYAYRGSMTYPPCTEGVEWRVLKQPFILSRDQKERLFTLIGRNTRLPQPVYFRTVYETP